ncbi:MAG: divergent PAP2 family protein [Anaerolineae bacterium]|nr:divergent PAP2 family protein [Anaerolineae bacterium]
MLMSRILELLNNDIMWVSIFASSFAQFLKPFTYWWRTKEFDWHHISETGGMPSSHSALISSLATGLGLIYGFDSPEFAIAVVLSMIITYDAQGVRRQAGEHARAINEIIAELLSGKEIGEKEFQEVLGHSRVEVAAGVLFGIMVMLAWKLLVQPLFI